MDTAATRSQPPAPVGSPTPKAHKTWGHGLSSRLRLSLTQPRFVRDEQAQGRYHLFRTCDLVPLCSVDILVSSDLLRRILAGYPYVKYRRTAASELSYFDRFFVACQDSSSLGMGGLNCDPVNKSLTDSESLAR